MNPLTYVNGYKQIVGLIIFGAGSAIAAAGFPEYGDPLVKVGGVLAGIGAFHQGLKKKKA